MATEASRSTRDRPAKAPLSRDAIVDAALGVLQREGLDAVTMRRVATELDTGAASLYVYVANRDELLGHMLDRVSATVELEPIDPARWREQLKAVLTDMVAAMDAHPGIARIAVARIPTGEGTLRVAERILALLRAGGVDDLSAAWACDVLALYATAAAYENSVYIASGVDETQIAALVEDVGRRFRSLPPDRFPHTTALAGLLTSGSGDERFQFGLDVLINGLVTTPPPTPAPAPE